MGKLFGNKTGKKPASKTGKKPESKADIKTGNKTAKKITDKTVKKAENKTAKKTVSKAENKTAKKTVSKADNKTAKKTVSKSGYSESKKLQQRRRHIMYGSLVVVGAFFIAAALRVILGGLFEDADARTEYESLRDAFPAVSGQTSPNNDLIPAIEEEEYENISDEINLRDLSLDELAALNRDFIGWITIGSSIDYPVVRGSDNTKYMNTTFLGHRNTAGAIFMDYRHTRGFDEPVSTIYGHHTRDGSMFSALVQYLNPAHIRSSPTINITARDGRTFTYRIFDARLTDAWDEAYTIGISDSARAAGAFTGAPANASHFMLLSTCTRSRNDDERILVLAAR